MSEQSKTERSDSPNIEWLTPHEARAIRLACIFGTPDPTPEVIVSALRKIKAISQTYSRWFTDWPSTHERAGESVEVVAVEAIRDLLPKVYDGMHLVDCPYVDVLQRIKELVG